MQPVGTSRTPGSVWTDPRSSADQPGHTSNQPLQHSKPSSNCQLNSSSDWSCLVASSPPLRPYLSRKASLPPANTQRRTNYSRDWQTCNLHHSTNWRPPPYVDPWTGSMNS
nr:hypothetical protein CFP56_63738 [Quercus suber]